MPRGDAVQEIPTLEQEMAEFKGFAVTNGQISDGGDSPEEQAAEAERAKAAEQAAAVHVANKEKQAKVPAEKEGEEGAPPANEANPSAKAPLKPLEEFADDEQVSVADVKRLISRAVGSTLAKERRQHRQQMLDMRRELDGQSGSLTRQSDAVTRQPASSAPDPTKYVYGEQDARYIADKARYDTAQEYEQRDKARTAEQTRTSQARQEQEFAERRDTLFEAGRGKYPDFDEVVVDTAEAGEWPLPPVVGQLMFESEHGADVAYYLATNPKEAVRISRLSPPAQAAAFGRLEARFASTAQSSSAAAGKPPVKVTKAPPPPKNKASGAGGQQPSAATTNFSDFERMAMC